AWEHVARLVPPQQPQPPLAARSVVPAPVEDHALARRRQVGQVPLDVHLGLLPLRRCWKSDHPENAGTDAFGDGLDRPALAGTIPPLEHDADLQPLVTHPLLHLHQLHVQLLEFTLVSLALNPAPAGDSAAPPALSGLSHLKLLSGLDGLDASDLLPAVVLVATMNRPRMALAAAHALQVAHLREGPVLGLGREAFRRPMQERQLATQHGPAALGQGLDRVLQ